MTDFQAMLDPARERIVRLLAADVAATLGGGQQDVVAAEVPGALEFTDSVEDFSQRLADDVQQVFHDTFADTTWPACPRHPNHPLWFRDGAWWCEADDVAMFALGELPGRRGDAEGG
jgi:hypothetical protein